MATEEKQQPEELPPRTRRVIRVLIVETEEDAERVITNAKETLRGALESIRTDCKVRVSRLKKELAKAVE